MLLLDRQVREGKLAPNKVNILIRWEQKPFIIIKETTLEKLYREFASKTQFEKCYEKFKSLKTMLLADEKYRNKWVAIVNDELIGPSDDDSQLSKIIDERYGNVPAYIGKIVEKEEPLELPSPELE